LAVAPLVFALLLGSGCQSQLLFRNDHRITIVAPVDFSNVKAPVTIRWVSRDFTAPADGHFEVFLDRDPLPPGETLQSYFAGQSTQFIWTTDQTSFRIPFFPLPDTAAPKFEQEHHEVTVIVVDAQGRRIGESSGFVEFNLL
jgi:hypothetical protein